MYDGTNQIKNRNPEYLYENEKRKEQHIYSLRCVRICQHYAQYKTPEKIDVCMYAFGLFEKKNKKYRFSNAVQSDFAKGLSAFFQSSRNVQRNSLDSFNIFINIFSLNVENTFKLSNLCVGLTVWVAKIVQYSETYATEMLFTLPFVSTEETKNEKWYQKPIRGLYGFYLFESN